MTCGAKFYDLNRSPITCPKCGTPFQAAPLTRAPAPAAARARDEEEPEAEAAGPELVSLEDVGAAPPRRMCLSTTSTLGTTLRTIRSSKKRKRARMTCPV